MPTKRTPLNLTDVERETLHRWARRPKTAQALATRCKIILLDAREWTYARIADKLDVRPQTVLKWRTRFLASRLDGLCDQPRRGVKRTVSDEPVEMVAAKTLQERPPDATNWSVRSIAKASGISRATVHRIWKAFGLQPHLV